MAKGYATRRYQLTINNPQEHGYDHNVIKAALEKGAKLLYWCMADEVGQEETYHIHLFLVYENPVMFTTLKNKFPTAHIEVPQWGKNSENYAYIRKEGAKYNKDANGHYKYTDSKGKVHEGINYSDTFEESGSLPPAFYNAACLFCARLAMRAQIGYNTGKTGAKPHKDGSP